MASDNTARERGAPLRPDRGGHPFGTVSVDIGDDHRRPLTGQRLGVRLTDPAAGPAIE